MNTTTDTTAREFFAARIDDRLAVKLAMEYPENFTTINDAEPVAGRIRHDIAEGMLPSRAVYNALEAHAIFDTPDDVVCSIIAAA